MQAPTETMQLTLPSDREVRLTRVFDAPRGLVFEALTRPRLLKRWLYGPDGWWLAVCEIEAQVGGKFRYVWQHNTGAEMGMSGVYRELLRPERIVQTELFDQDWTGGETLATLVLREHDGQTTLTNTLGYASREARDGVLRTPMESGMAEGYERLAMLLDALQGR